MTTTILRSSSSAILPLNYLIFLTCLLVIYLVYLILPRGLRAYLCGAKKRYRLQRHHHDHGVIWKQSTLSSDGLFKAMTRQNGNVHDHFQGVENTRRQLSEFTTPRLGATRGPDQYWGIATQNSAKSTPDPYVTPEFRQSINWHSTKHDMIGAPLDNKGHQGNNLLHLLKHQLNQSPGIKMIAHGTKCNPRPVWITLHFNEGKSAQQLAPLTAPDLEYQNCLTWQAELHPNKKSITSPSNTTSLKLGNLRKASFHDILGVEQGKCTMALRHIQTAKMVDEKECLSLLTNSGTLYLQCLLLGNLVNASAGEVREGFIGLLGMALGLSELRLNDLQLSPSPAMSSVAPVETSDEISRMTNCTGGSDGFGNAPVVLTAAPTPRDELSHAMAKNHRHDNSSQQSVPAVSSCVSADVDANLSVVSF